MLILIRNQEKQEVKRPLCAWILTILASTIHVSIGIAIFIVLQVQTLGSWWPIQMTVRNISFAWTTSLYQGSVRMDFCITAIYIDVSDKRMVMINVNQPAGVINIFTKILSSTKITRTDESGRTQKKNALASKQILRINIKKFI